ncbi:MAG: CocE/NonD family hydrolase [Gemmatimonadota bacterium]|nr:CocE/NonD family hydrolase [Gemmatimonadota bacterium]
MTREAGSARTRHSGRYRAIPLVLLLAVQACGVVVDDTNQAGAGTPAPPGADQLAGGPYDVVAAMVDSMVPMRDGVRLATDVYRPARDGVPVEDALPALLQRTPYDKTASGLVAQARWLASHGYVVVLQDTRGLYGSEGVFQKYFEYDAPDGYDTIEWIAGLDFVEPKVGMWGTSYGAHTQADAAKMAPPALATIVPTMGGISDAWTHKVRFGGAFELGQQLGWAHLQLAAASDDPAVRERLASEPVSEWFDQTPFRPGENPLSVAPNFEDYYLTMQNEGDYDDYWRGIGRNWVEYYDQTADIPMLHVGGWYDTYARGTIESFAGLSASKSGPVRLVMGPWTHGGNTRTFAGDVEFGAAAAIVDFRREFHLRWFDRWLKDDAAAAVPESPVRLFVMGGGDGTRTEDGRIHHGGEWREADSWPLPETALVPFYFGPEGALGEDRPDGVAGSSLFTYDPSHPVPTIGGSFSGALKSGGYDQRERPFRSLRGGSDNGFYASTPPYPRLRDRPDVLVFETPPLEEDVIVVGPIVVRLWISSTAVDTDFTAKLVDVYPPSDDWPEGFDLNITDGIARARYRSSRETQELMRPGEVYEVTIETFPTANLFRAGHRIRVDISSSNYPRFDLNPNTGEPLGRHTSMIPADNTVYHDAARPSHVLLPVLGSAAAEGR